VGKISRSHGPPWECISVHQVASVKAEKSQMNKQLAVWVTTEDRGNQKPEKFEPL
jgi:hypothetical protein